MPKAIKHEESANTIYPNLYPTQTPNTNMSLEINMLVKLIPTFDTTKTQEVYGFIRSCDTAFQFSNAENKPILLAYVLNNIKGTGAPDIHCRQYATWEDLKSFLIEKFSNVKTISHLNLELQSLFQKPGESITDYFHRVDLCRSKIIEKLNTEFKDHSLIGRMEMTEETALSVFVNGLCNEIGTMLRTRGFLNLAEAGRFAMEEEKIRAMNIARQSLFKSNISNQSKSSNNNTPRNQITRSYTQGNTKICNYCKNPGHLISECRKRAYNNNLRNNNPNSHTHTTQNTQSQQRALPAPPAQSRPPTQRALPPHVHNLNSNATVEMSNSPEIASTSCSTIATPTSALDTESLQLQW